MSFQGQISSLALADVVQNLASNKKTGTLSVQAPDASCHLQFREGVLISYTGDRVGIAEWLVEKGVVADESMRQALRKFRRARKKSLGRILADQGALDLREFAVHLESLVSDGLCEALTLTEGTFEFREGDLRPELADTEVLALGLRFSVQSLVMESARRADDWAVIRRHLPPEGEIYYVPGAERESLIAAAEDDLTRDALELLDGTRTLRQVIAQLPWSRFDAMYAIAQLIGEKKLRPLESAIAIQRADSEWDPVQSIAQLRAVVDREPNNREALVRLARLYEEQGSVEEAAKHQKILAHSYLEEKDFRQAREHLRKAAQLNPRDVTAWQKLWDTHVAIGDDKETFAFGKRYVEHFKKLGFTELVRDQLAEMLRKFPDDAATKIELARSHAALGEHEEATALLLESGRDLLRNERYDQAEKVFSIILKYDHKNERARKLCEEIRSGRLERRRARRRRIRRRITLAIAAGTLAFLVAREYSVQDELLEIARTAIAEEALDGARQARLARRLEAVRSRYPWSPTAAARTSSFLEALELEGARREGKAGNAAAPLPVNGAAEHLYPFRDPRRAEGRER